MSQDIRDQIAARFVEALNAGTIPWRKPWSGGTTGRPHNVTTRKPYRGTNALYLGLVQMVKDYPTGQWATFKGVQSLGGRVLKGEKATGIMFWKFLKTTDKTTGREKTIPLVKHFNVFNIAQTEGCKVPTVPAREVSPIAAAEAIVANMPKRPTMRVVESTSAHYTPSTDTVTLPLMSQFVNAASYYATAFHELAHSTGHASRLDRSLDGSFGSDPYSREELIAEMTSAFLSAECNILDDVEDNSKAYVQHWAARLGKEPRLILDAASAAQKAADYILNVKFGEEAAADDE